MALHPINPLLQLKAEFLLPHLDTRGLCAPSEMFSLLWSLICYQSICKYHVIKREMRNSRGDFQYFLPLRAAPSSSLPAAPKNGKIVQTPCSLSLRRSHSMCGVGNRSIGGEKKILSWERKSWGEKMQQEKKKSVFLGLVKMLNFHF